MRVRTAGLEGAKPFDGRQLSAAEGESKPVAGHRIDEPGTIAGQHQPVDVAIDRVNGERAENRRALNGARIGEAIAQNRIGSEFPLKQAGRIAHPTKIVAIRQDEARIRELHTQLQITPAQEDLWTNVAQVMRDNAHRMETLTQARAAKAPTMTALDDLKTYTDIVEAHAEGLKTFTPAFAALYDHMSDAQKQQADAVFRSHSQMRMARHEAHGH